MNKSLPELLAPAGTPEAAWAALSYGADAVYAGLSRFSARAEAGNFSAGELDELIGYAHHLGRRVYVTFNTLVQQRELSAAMETLSLISDLHADGVIVQDMGVIELIRQHFPQIRLHASTQLAVHNLEGARQLASLGFKRVVLARELSVSAIEHISSNCGIETETFVHGALCYSYSGLCLFSSHLLGRSGNRGRCAYCCRQSFCDADGIKNLPFSMKDFSAAGHLPALLAAGVSSLKMEGRMKSPLYVAAVTDFYRKALAGDLDNAEQLLADIQTLFGRPSTDLYLQNPQNHPIDPVNDGHRGAQIGTVLSLENSWLIFHSSRALQKHDGLKIEMPGETSAYGCAADEMRLARDPEAMRRFDLPAGAEIAVQLPADAPHLATGSTVYCSYSQAVRQRYSFSAPRPGQFRQRRPVNIRVSQALEEVVLTASADGVQTRLVLPGPFERPRQPEKSLAAIRTCFEKLGDTDWRLNELSFNEESVPVFVPVSVLNDARRRLITAFSEQWKTRQQTPLQPAPFPADPVRHPLSWSVKARRFLLLENIDEFVLEVDPAHPEEIEKALAAYSEKLRLALPVILRDEQVAAFRELILKFPAICKWEAANVGGLYLLRKKQDVTADWPLYTLNAQAARLWREQNVRHLLLSPEDDSENWSALLDLLGDAAVLPVYQHTPLMISATHPAAQGSELTDRSQRVFRMDQNGSEFVLTRKIPFSLIDQLDELQARGARHFRIDLSYGVDSILEAADLVRHILTGRPVPGHSGNFLRSLE